MSEIAFNCMRNPTTRWPNAKMESIEDYIRETNGLFDELSKEIDLVAKLLPTESWTRKKYAEPTTFSAVERRLLVRSVFSFIEALIYRLKIGALLETEERLSPGEVALAKEEDYELADSGTVKTRNARLRFLSNFRFAFYVSAKASDVEFHLDVGGDGWTALRCALSVRDRITHPKVAGDLVISDDEVRSAMKAYTWTLDQWGILALTSLRHHLKKKGEP